MRIPSGSTDRYVYFVAVDSTDLKTRETGLTTFTVYASRNGAAAAAFTTPTVNETDATNMPGVYELLLDEQTTLTAGNDTEELCLHITQASMAPVTRVVELYRPETTEGNTLDVTATGAGGIDWGNVENQGTSVDLSATSTNLVDTTTTNTDMRGTDSALLAASAPANFGDLAITVTTGQVTVGTNNDKTGYSVADATSDAVIADAVWNALTASYGSAGTYGEQVEGLDTSNLDAAVSTRSSHTAADAADAVWDEAKAGHVGVGSFGEEVQAHALSSEITALNDISTAQVNAEVDTALADYDPPTKAEMDAGFAALNDPTSAAIAGAVWDEAKAGHVAVGSFGEEVQDHALSSEITALNDPTAVQIRQEMDSNSTQLAAIVADTNELQTDLADGGRVDLLIDAIKAVTDLLPGSVHTTAMTESYSTKGGTVTVAQALYEILSHLQEFTIAGTTKTCKQVDGSTTATTHTLNDGTSPTGIARAT